MFLTPEEKLVNLRKKYKITQKELSDGVVARPFLGMIEIKKKRLTMKTARILCDRIDEIFKKRGITDNISFEELMESKEIQGKKYLIKALSDGKFDYWKTEASLYEIGSEERIGFCEKIAKYYQSCQNLELSKYYYMKCLVELDETSHKKNILLEITRQNYFLENYSETLNLYLNFSNMINENIDTTSERIIFNYAHALEQLGHFDDTITTLEKLIKTTQNRDLLFKSKNILAYLTYSHKKNYEKAQKIYRELIDLGNINEEFMVYINLLKIELKENNLELVKSYLEKIIQLKNIGTHVHPETDIVISILKSDALLKLKKIDEAKKILWDTYFLNRSTKNYTPRETQIVLKLCQLFSREDLEKVKSILSNTQSILENHDKVYIAILSYFDKYGYEKEKKNLFSQILSFHESV